MILHDLPGNIMTLHERRGMKSIKIVFSSNLYAPSSTM